jgi:hypothetical protein
MPSRLEVYQERAETCRRNAASAENAAERNHWLTLAEQWTEIADEEEKRPPSRLDGDTAERLDALAAIYLEHALALKQSAATIHPPAVEQEPAQQQQVQPKKD